MTAPVERAKQFWSAANFYRRAPERDRSQAIRVLEHVSQTATGAIQSRAINLLREIHEQSASPEK